MAGLGEPDVTSRRGGLGRGLGALIPTGEQDEYADAHPVAGAVFQEIDIERVQPNPRQPRVHFDEEAQAELVASIREVGLLQPVVVRETTSGDFELVMGERRWRAAQQAGLTRLPAIIRETDDQAMLRDALLENLHRQQLNPLEEAAAYQQLLSEFDATHEELAQRIGRSRSQVTNTLRLLNLPPAVQRRVAAGVLTAGHARALLALPEAEHQEQMATRVVAEGMSVRALEEAVSVSPSTRDRRGPGSPQPPPEYEHDEVAEALADHLETRVRIERSRRKGRIVIDFATAEDLNRIATSILGNRPDRNTSASPGHG